MGIDFIPVWLVFVGTILVVLAAIEAGHRIGKNVQRRNSEEKESPISAITGAILGLAAFMLAFAFGLVWDRYDTRKAFVREDAAAIRTAWQRSDFLPEGDRAEALAMFKSYIAIRIKAGQAARLDAAQMAQTNAETLEIQDRLWNMAVVNARKDMNSDVAALYIDALNAMNIIHAMRIAVAVHTRIPIEIRVVLYLITLLGMAGVGYQTGIAESKRSISWPFLALSFAMAIALIAILDRPDSGIIRVPQQPLIDVQAQMDAKAVH
jgi:hypothetical protein